MMINELYKENWTEIYTLDDPNESYNLFQEIPTHVYNKAFSLVNKGTTQISKDKRQPIQKVNQDSDS